MSFKIMIEADRAIFTRPEFKVERVSYDVPTPTALEGVLKSIFWKPAIRYVIDKIIVFNPIVFSSIKRNELKSKISLESVKKVINGADRDLSIYREDDISQRSTTYLCNVKYGIEFHFEMTGIRSDHEGENDDKYSCMIRRRIEKGQYFKAPCMGCREFPINKLYLVDTFDLSLVDKSLKGDVDLGYMLYQLKYHDNPKLSIEWNSNYFSDKTDALFYRPHMIDGIVDISKYREVIKC